MSENAGEIVKSPLGSSTSERKSPRDATVNQTQNYDGNGDVEGLGKEGFRTKGDEPVRARRHAKRENNS
jgi:hypothetical protein